MTDPVPGSGSSRWPPRTTAASGSTAAGPAPWSGRRSILGWLDDDDVSLTYDAARGEVVRHVGGADDGGRRRHLRGARGRDGRRRRRTCTGSATSATPAGPTCPPLVDPADPMPTAVWMRTTHVHVVEHPERRPTEPRGLPDPRSGGSEVPEEYAAAFADVQEQLRAGNSYEVNLTYRLTVRQRPRPGDGVPPAPRRSTPRRTPGSSSTAAAGCSARRPSGTPPSTGTGGSRPSRSRAPRRAARRPRRTTRAARAAGHRPEVPGREPDDRRPAPQRPRHGLRGRVGRGAGADGRRVLPVGAPAGVDGPRRAPRRRHHGRGAARALPGRLDDRCAQAAHDGGDPRRRGHRPRRVRRRVRLDLRRRPGRPRRGDPQPDHRRRRHLDARHRRRRSRSAPTWPRSTPSPAGRPSDCCGSSTRARPGP